MMDVPIENCYLPPTLISNKESLLPLQEAGFRGYSIAVPEILEKPMRIDYSLPRSANS
jgi:hypothetical protein